MRPFKINAAVQAADQPVISLTANTIFVPVSKPSSRVIATQEQCLVGIVNRSATAPLHQIRVTLLRGGQDLFEVGSVDLAALQSTVLKHNMAPGKSCSGADVLFQVAFDRQSAHNEMVISSTSEGRSIFSVTSNIIPLMSAAFGLVSGLLGAWVAHFWTIRIEREKDRLTMIREREKDRVVWRTELFKASEPAFRTFLLGWNSSLDVETLRKQFELLKNAVVVPLDIIAAYEKTYGVLVEPSSLRNSKQESAERLDRK
jgi:hypothetical protein